MSHNKSLQKKYNNNKPSYYQLLQKKRPNRMSMEIQENITKILKNQNCKKNIESKLITKRAKKSTVQVNNDRIEMGFMLFQVVKDGYVTDHMHWFPCQFDLRGPDSRGQIIERRQKQTPKIGSFIRTIKMDFDLKRLNLIIYDYQYLGGAGSMVPSNGTRVNWNSETIGQIIRRNNTVKGGEMLLESYNKDRLAQIEPFQYPPVKFLTIELLRQILTEPAQQQNTLSHKNIEKITAPKYEMQVEDNDLQKQQQQSGAHVINDCNNLINDEENDRHKKIQQIREQQF